MHRPLEPMLTAVAAAGAIAMLLSLMLAWRRSRRLAGDRRVAAIPAALRGRPAER